MKADDIKQLLIDAGACAAGVVLSGRISVAEEGLLAQWLGRGCHGSMDYLARNATLAADPASLLPGCRSVVVAAFCYAPADEADRTALFADYARGADYHKAVRRRLKPVARIIEGTVAGSATRMCVDSAPVRERYWAVQAGIGFIGRNGTLIVPGVGSKVFIGEILWTGVPDDLVERAQVSTLPSCMGCDACVRACPGGAITGNGSVDARRCLSYLTIEHRGALPDDMRLPGRIYGCDICQDVCPHNRTAASPLPEYLLRIELKAVTADSLASMSADAYASLSSGSAIRRASLEQLRRNLRRRK